MGKGVGDSVGGGVEDGGGEEVGVVVKGIATVGVVSSIVVVTNGEEVGVKVVEEEIRGALVHPCIPKLNIKKGKKIYRFQ